MPDPNLDNPVNSVSTPTPTPVINQEEENRKREQAAQEKAAAKKEKAIAKAAAKEAKAAAKEAKAEAKEAKAAAKEAAEEEKAAADKKKEDLKKMEPSKTGNSMADDLMETLLKIQEVGRILQDEKNFGIIPLFKKANNYFKNQEAKAEEKQLAKLNAKASAPSNFGKMTAPANTSTPPVVNAANFNSLNKAKDVAQPDSSPNLDIKPNSPQLN